MKLTGETLCIGTWSPSATAVFSSQANSSMTALTEASMITVNIQKMEMLLNMY